MPDWVSGNEALLWWVGAVGLLTFLLSAIAVPFLVARLPADYLTSDRDDDAHRPGTSRAIWISLLILRNIVGWLVLLAGLAMLITPGQGLLAIFVGLTLINFPGKRHLLRSLLQRPAIYRAANWIRNRCGVNDLKLPE